jgi:hypothetical protein
MHRRLVNNIWQEYYDLLDHISAYFEKGEGGAFKTLLIYPCQFGHNNGDDKEPDI